MKTILCPLDFSPKSDQLLSYVGQLAKDRNCKIYLISTQTAKRKEYALVASQNGNAKLDELHDYFNNVEGIPCGIVDESLTGNLYKKLGTLADRFDILAMMISASGQEINLNLKKIIQDTLAPILIIPDQFKYKPINRLLYAYDYKHEDEAPLMQLSWLADWFDAKVVMVTLLPGESSIKEEEKLKSITSAIDHDWIGPHPISFETIVYHSLPKGFENFLGLSDANDLLVLSINHQNIMERIWHRRVVKGVLKYSQRPYLIIHQ